LQKEIKIFFDEISEFYNSNKSLVVFRKPDDTNITAYIQNDDALYSLNSFEKQGFVFVPFNKSEKPIIFPVEKCKKLTSEISDKVDLEITKNNSTFKVVSDKNSEENHIQLVQKGINFINNSAAKKVVLSRKETLEFDKFEVINTLKKMLNSYKNAFVYLWVHPRVGLWMGATPERLLSVSDNKFETMALAGTQLFKKSTNVIWKEKEQQEQQFVTDYIVENIKNSIDKITVSDAYTVKAGNLLHIRTDILGELKSSSSLGNLIDSLHPTPAVCGLPKEKAIKFILKNEGYDRAYYTGYLGELNIDNSTSLFVNLRCMQLNNSTASIYIGGGITKDSISKNEWEETVSKAEVMKKVLENKKVLSSKFFIRNYILMITVRIN